MIETAMPLRIMNVADYLYNKIYLANGSYEAIAVIEHKSMLVTALIVFKITTT